MSDTTTVNATFPTDVQPAAFAYRFKKDDVGNQRAKVEITAPVASLTGIKYILELPTAYDKEKVTPEQAAVFEANKKQQDLLLEAMYDIYRDVIGDWVAADEANTDKNFDPSKYTWSAIANMPKEDRRSSSIPKEVWDKFAADYGQVMATVANRTKDQIASAVMVFTKKFSPVKTNKPVIKFLQGQLGLYLEHTQQADQFSDILELLVRKAATLLEDKSADSLIGNLGM
jgi:hypothetical protein